MYAARTGRAALAAHRRDLTAADRSNGFTVREVRGIQAAAGLHIVAGPLTTVQAYRYDLVCALASEATRWTEEIIEPPVGDIRDEDMVEITRRVDQRYGTGTADRIRAIVAKTYAQPTGQAEPNTGS